MTLHAHELAPARPKLSDVIPEANFRDAVERHLVKIETHPHLPYWIANYTDAAVWDQVWTPATLACRGLIIDAGTGEVIARPWPKFFNVDQPQAPVLDPDEEIVVFDKLDGSLGILHPLPDGGHALATRSRFLSEQAVWATERWKAAYADRFIPNPAWTYLFEIVYDNNRVVVDYPFEDLVLLGAVDIVTGRTVPLDAATAGWPGPVVEVLPYTTLREVLAAADRGNTEGYVLWQPDRDVRVKWKRDEYKKLHRILTQTDERHVWEALAAGIAPAEAFAGAPDEFHGWVRDVVARLEAEHAAIVCGARDEHAAIVASLDSGYSRKDFALAATSSRRASLLFLVEDGRDEALTDSAWKLVKPPALTTFRTTSNGAD
jgi:RNA ligase